MTQTDQQLTEFQQDKKLIAGYQKTIKDLQQQLDTERAKSAQLGTLWTKFDFEYPTNILLWI